MEKSLVLFDKNKKNKHQRSLNLLYNKMTQLTSHIDFLFKNKYILQDFYIEKMYVFSDIQNKMNILEKTLNEKKYNKKFVDGFIEDIQTLIENVSLNIGSENLYSILSIFQYDQLYLDTKTNESKYLLSIYNSYFIPLSITVIKDTKNFLIDNEIVNLDIPNVIPLTKKKQSFTEKVEGATIVLYIHDEKILCVHGIFRKDSLGFIKKFPIFKMKMESIQKEIDYLNLPDDFKEKYLEQLNLKDLIIMNYLQIVNQIKYDYEEYLKFKSKSLSSLVKEFIKLTPERQRKIIILFLIGDDESQFTAHIIYDLIIDQCFLYENEKLSDVLFNSLHWKIQKGFKISQTKFENNKKKIENVGMEDIPYESKIMSMKSNEIVKGKALEKLKEINGSKENSIKAQQWLDGLLKIPFGIYKKEDIIYFFENYKVNLNKYVDIFSIKISDYNTFSLNEFNKKNYEIIVDIINVYNANGINSEHTCEVFIDYLKTVMNKLLQNLLDEMNKNQHLSIENHPYKEEIVSIMDSINNIYQPKLSSLGLKLLISKLNLLHNLYYHKNIGSSQGETNTEPTLEADEDLGNEKEETELEHDNDQYNLTYNINFINFILKNMDEYNQFILDWDDFRKKKKEYIVQMDDVLDKCTYGQTDAKKQMKRIIGQWMNGNMNGQCIGLHGPAGVGKTTISKNGLAKCLVDDEGKSRPFAFLPLGGATNGSILEGHHYTYLGSTWGKIVDILMETKCMNPIIYIDELDKISKTEHGREIISILTHITDQSQNKEYFDRYFASIPIDLSQVLFIFSYNDRDNIDRILLDRIQEIHIDALSCQEKIIISQNYVLPKIYKDIGFNENEILFQNEVLEKIINEYTYEPGIRKLNEILYDVIREVNLNKINGDIINYPYKIDDFILEDVLSMKTKIRPKKINDVPKVGLVNGLYATGAGLGGITIIQAKKTISDKKFGLEKLTGSQGDVMKESMSCAFTVAGNLINEEYIKQFEKDNEHFGVHIHCPDGATPKDGPSAGLAITTCLVSLITKIPIRNDVAMTGEIDLEGNAGEIGGLYSKIQGALNAGVKKVLVPRNNVKDLDVIFRKEEQDKKNIKSSLNIRKVDSFLLLDKKCYITEKDRRIFRNTLEIIIVDSIHDVLKHALVENDFQFNENV
jgi:predicted RNA-binding protein Jag